MSNRRNSIYPLLILIPLPPAIHAKEHASTKKVVGNALALNLVTQLYEMGAIEPARAPGTKKPADVVRPYHNLFTQHSLADHTAYWLKKGGLLSGGCPFDTVGGAKGGCPPPRPTG